MHVVQELHKVPQWLWIIVIPSIFSLHSSTNLLTHSFLCIYNFHSLFSNITWSLYSHSQLIGFQINTSWHILFSINSLHSHLHLSLFQRCLLLQALASSLHLHPQVSYHFICLVSLVLDTRLNTLVFMFLTASGTHNFAYGSLMLLQLPLHLFVLIL